MSQLEKAHAKADLEHFAAQIADGLPVSGSELASSHVSPGEQTALKQLADLAGGFRRALRVAAPAPAPLFRFCGLDVLQKLGEGSFSDVYRAYDPVLDHEVALKVKKVDDLTLSHTFIEEARHLARLRHPNILSVFGAAVDKGTAGIWTELIPGRTLAEVVNAQGRLSAEEVRVIGRDICHALAYVHRNGLAHGDVKLENIMRDDFGRIVLTDFGAAKAFRNEENESFLYGSIRYLAPEIFEGEGISPASDIYSLGVALFRLLTAHFPYLATNAEDLARQHRDGHSLEIRQFTPDAPRSLCKAIEAAIAVDPKERHRSAHAFAIALESKETTRFPIRYATLALLSLGLLVSILFFGMRDSNWNPGVKLYRAGALGYRELRDGDSVRLGDGFSLEFSSARPAFLYVIDDDGSPKPAVLFPSNRLKTVGPAVRDAELRLPGETITGTVEDWQVNEDSVDDEIIVVASRTRIPGVEEAVAAWQNPGPVVEPNEANDAPRRGAHGYTPAPNSGIPVPKEAVPGWQNSEPVVEPDEGDNALQRGAHGSVPASGMLRGSFHRSEQSLRAIIAKCDPAIARLWVFRLPHSDHGKR